ncbi:MAG: MFS transporter [Herpetosiphon sp.]
MTSRWTGLWRHRDFMRLWIGQTVSDFGSLLGALQFTALLVLHASAWQMGLLGAATTLPVLLAGLQAGVWIDRLRRRPLMIAADLGRALLLCTIPIAALSGVLRMPYLYIVAFLVGLMNVVFNVAYQSLLPTIVGRERLIEGNSKLNTSNNLAEITGNGVGGFLAQLLGAPLLLVVDAATFLVSALSLSQIRTAESPISDGTARHHLWRESLTGLSAIRRQPVLRVLVGTSALHIFFGGFWGAVYGLFIIRTLQLGPAVLGVAVGSGGIGALFGSAIARSVVRRFGWGRTLIGAAIFSVPFAALTPLAGGSVIATTSMVLASQIIGDTGHSIAAITELSLLQSLTPDHLLGRVNASLHWLLGIAGLAGLLVGGLSGEIIGPRATIMLAVLGQIPPILWMIYSPLRSLPNDIVATTEDPAA